MKEKIQSWKEKIREDVQHQFIMEPPRKLIQNCLYMFLGAFLLALGTEFFLVPMNIISGGDYSLAIIFHSIPALSALSTEMYILIFNWFYFLLGLVTLGIHYSIKTLLVTIFYPCFVFLIDLITSHVIYNGVAILDISKVTGFAIDSVNITDAGAMVIAYLVAALLGGYLVGVGVGLAMVGGGSSGGTDVQVLLMHKAFHISIGTASLISDCLIIFAGFFANGANLLATLVGIGSAVVCAQTIDQVFNSKSSCYMAFIVSKKWQEINSFILEHIERGTTIIKAQGGFSGVDTMLLEVSFDRQDYTQVEAIINKIDPNAFVTIMKTQEVLGYGFTRGTPEVEAKDIALSPDETERILIKARKKRDRYKEAEDENNSAKKDS
jgi:uncharacterized membrane-anchored protein YitT (DUF2179 family)